MVGCISYRKWMIKIYKGYSEANPGLLEEDDWNLITLGLH